MKHTSLLAAMAVVIASNALVLLGVARNRSAVSQELELTERELRLQRSGEEDSGISLWLQWVDPSLAFSDSPGWFDQVKLEQVGFDVRTPVTDASAEIKYRDVLPREAFVVFAYGGATWEAWVKAQQERMTKQFGHPPQQAMEQTGTRLLAVDAGRDAAELRRRYPDQAGFLVIRAVVRLMYPQVWDPKTKRQIPSGPLRGYIEQVTPREIHVPLPYASVLLGSGRYVVTLRFGSRYEPWIAAVRRM